MDPCYPHKRHLQDHLSGISLRAQEKANKSSMSRVIVTFEWFFGEVIN